MGKGIEVGLKSSATLKTGEILLHHCDEKMIIKLFI